MATSGRNAAQTASTSRAASEGSLSAIISADTCLAEASRRGINSAGVPDGSVVVVATAEVAGVVVASDWS